MKTFSVLWTLLALAGASTSADERLMREGLHHHLAAAEVIPDETRGPLRLGLALEGSGAHRQLRYSLHAPCAGAQQAAQCRAALLQPLPAGVYADVYELQDAASRGHGPEVRLFGKVDVESIAAYSEPTLLAVYAAAASREEERPTGYCYELHASVALHARYPEPSMPASSSWADAVLSRVQRLELAPPTVLLDCGGEGWRLASLHVDGGPVAWDVPAGNLQQAGLVSAVTAAWVLAGAAVLLWVLHRTGGPPLKEL